MQKHACVRAFSFKYHHLISSIKYNCTRAHAGCGGAPPSQRQPRPADVRPHSASFHGGCAYFSTVSSNLPRPLSGPNSSAAVSAHSFSRSPASPHAHTLTASVSAQQLGAGGVNSPQKPGACGGGEAASGKGEGGRELALGHVHSLEAYSTFSQLAQDMQQVRQGGGEGRKWREKGVLDAVFEAGRVWLCVCGRGARRWVVGWR